MNRDLALIRAMLRFIRETSMRAENQTAPPVYFDDPATRAHLNLLIDEGVVTRSPIREPIRSEDIHIAISGWELLDYMIDEEVWRAVLDAAGTNIDRMSLADLRYLGFKVVASMGGEAEE